MFFKIYANNSLALCLVEDNFKINEVATVL
jgi:hypothetical protein